MLSWETIMLYTVDIQLFLVLSIVVGYIGYMVKSESGTHKYTVCLSSVSGGRGGYSNALLSAESKMKQT